MVQLETTYCTDYEIISQIHNEWENVAVQSKTDEITFEVSFDSDFWLIHRDNWSIIIATSPHNGSKEKPNVMRNVGACKGRSFCVKVQLCNARERVFVFVKGQILDASALHLILVQTEGSYRRRVFTFISIFYKQPCLNTSLVLCGRMRTSGRSRFNYITVIQM